MRSRGWWAALVAVALSSTWLLAGCSSVESCTQYSPGCIDGAPDQNGQCKFGLVPDSTGTKCIKRGTTAPTGTGGGGTCPGGCKSGELCRADGKCINPCSTPSNLPAKQPVLIPCRAPSGTAAYDFQMAAVALCYQACSHRAAYCGGKCDPTTECTPTLASTAATLLCPGQGPECAMTACEKARDTACADQNCAGNKMPDCSGVVCTNSCTDQSGQSFNFDGYCDDGDLSNAASAICNWGSDCGDCGPRKGSAPAFSVDLGDPCVDPLQCGGDIDHIDTSTGWCLPPDNQKATQVCLPDCSGNKTCPSGFTCYPLMFTVNGKQQDVMDSAGNKASACFPTQCAN